jgi:hypothetical protein
MAVLDFPPAPANGAIYTNGERSWRWDAANQQWDSYTAVAAFSFSGLEAARPVAPATPGIRYYATDTKREFLWDGTGWIIMSEPMQAFTATPRQNSIALTFTPTSPTSFQRSGGWVRAHVQMTITGTGTNAQPFDATLVGLPNLVTWAGGAAGTFVYYDASFGSYVGIAQLANGATQVSFACHNSNWTLGGNPAFQAANGDSFSFALHYEMASKYN